MVETQTRQMSFCKKHASRANNGTVPTPQATQQQLLEQMKPQAIRCIKPRLVLRKLPRLKIFRLDEDFDKEVEKLAEAYKMEADKVVKC